MDGSRSGAPLGGVGESEHFLYLVTEHESDYSDFDEVTAPVIWALAHEPEYYPSAPDPRIRVAYAMGFGTVPAIWIYYTVDRAAERCTLQWFTIVEETG